MRILALDWGEVRIGAAVSDEEGKIAFPLDKVIAAGKAIEEIKKIIDELKVGKVLIGDPKSLSGKENASTGKTSEFTEKLKLEISIPIERIDERFSSVAAGNALDEQGLSAKQQREIKDNIAAQLMLQQYLDMNKK